MNRREIIKEAIFDTLQDIGDSGAPSGVLYSALMHIGVTLDEYNSILSELKAENKVKESNFLLTAIG